MHTVSTDCQALDGLLDGGLESDAITLVFGEGGSGKTNLALQCARVAIAAGHRVAYVDTEGVSEKRLEQVFETLPEDERASAIDRLLFYTPYSIAEQESMIKRTALLKDVGLIVVDSVNMHYRLHIDAPGGEKEAGQSLLAQLHHLTMHARRHHIPVLITGQVYGGEDATQPFARRTMEHMVKALVRFEKRPDGTRRATVLKHRSIEEGRQARFAIGPNGLEDVSRPPVPAPASASSPPHVGHLPAGQPQRLTTAEAQARFERLRRDREAEASQEDPAWDPERDPERDPEQGPSREHGPASEGTKEARAATGTDRRQTVRDADGTRAGAGMDGSQSTVGTDEDPTAEDADASDVSGVPDGPATELLSESERIEAESLPGFTQAHKIPRTGENLS